MSNGDSSIYFAANGASLVIGLEPFPARYELAKENIGLNRFENKIKPLNVALAPSQGKSDLRLWSNMTMNVRTTTIDSLIRDFHVTKFDLIKMDCEGCEYNVLRSLSPQSFCQIHRLILEFHDGPKDLPLLLRSHGFRVKFEGRQMGYLIADRDMLGWQFQRGIERQIPLQNFEPSVR